MQTTTDTFVRTDSGYANAQPSSYAARMLPEVDFVDPMYPRGWPSTVPMGLGSPMRTSSVEELEIKKVRQVTDIMATFVSTHLAMHAHILKNELNSMRGLTQIKTALPSYRILALSVGLPGQQHMAQLEKLIS